MFLGTDIGKRVKRLFYEDDNGGGQRLFCYDNLKFLLMFCVVLGHFLDDNTIQSGGTDNERIDDLINEIFVFVYAFHMPCFLFISGLFDKKRDKLNSDSLLFYIIMGLLLNVEISFAQMLFLDDKSDNYFSLLNVEGVYWFLFALAAYKALCYLLRYADPKLIMTLSVLLALFSGYDDELGEWLSLSRIIVFFPFYYAGSLIDPQKLINVTRKLWVKLLSLSAAAAWFYFCFYKSEKVLWLRRLFTGKNPYSKIQLPNCEFWHRGIAMLISAALCIALISLVPNIRLPFVSKFGKRTFQVYFLHRPVIFWLEYTVITEEIQRIYPNSWWIVLIAASMAITIVLSAEIFQKPFDAALRAISRGRANNLPAQTEIIDENKNEESVIK